MVNLKKGLAILVLKDLCPACILTIPTLHIADYLVQVCLVNLKLEDILNVGGAGEDKWSWYHSASDPDSGNQQ